jgi:hypothetical protein
MNYYNRKTRIIASTLGILLGLGGIINHGLFEILQGYTPANGLFIEAIGESQRFWIYGTEGAFTLIPNFLITGICVSIVSLGVMIWSIKFIHSKHGSAVFLALMILMTLIGGGIGHIVFFLLVWAYSTRINKPLKWCNNILSGKIRKILAKIWLPLLLLTCISWLIVLELGIFGYFPGQADPDRILNITIGFLLLTVTLANATFICGFARDIEARIS